MKITFSVRLEPALEEQAALWSPSKRREVARVYERWARQLRVSAAVIEARKGQPPTKFGPLPKRRVALN